MAQFAPTYMTVYDTDGPDVPLVDLTVTPATVDSGAAAAAVIGAIGNKQAGSTIAIIDGNGMFAITGSNLVVGAVVLVDGVYPVKIRETTQFAPNSPRTTTVNITVT